MAFLVKEKLKIEVASEDGKILTIYPDSITCNTEKEFSYIPENVEEILPLLTQNTPLMIYLWELANQINKYFPDYNKVTIKNVTFPGENYTRLYVTIFVECNLEKSMEIYETFEDGWLIDNSNDRVCALVRTTT